MRFPPSGGNIPAINTVHTGTVGHPAKHIQVSGRRGEAIAHNRYGIWCNYAPRPRCAPWTAGRRRRRCTTDRRSRWCRRWRECSCWTWSRRWRRTWAGSRDVDIALPTGSRATRAVAEVLIKGGIVLLHSGRGAGVTIRECPVDNIEAGLSLVQSQLKIGTATSWEVLRPPFNVEDAVGSRAT